MEGYGLVHKRVVHFLEDDKKPLAYYYYLQWMKTNVIITLTNVLLHIHKGMRDLWVHATWILVTYAGTYIMIKSC